MSLRTKLLAAVVGLNGAILLLALYLLLRTEPEDSVVPPRMMVADLVQLGAAVVGLGPTDSAGRRRTLNLLDDLESTGAGRDILVVEENPVTPDLPRGGHRVWRIQEYFRAERRGPAIEEGAEWRRAVHAFEQARRNRHQWAWFGEDTVAAVLPVGLANERRLGLVAQHVVLPDQRSGVRLVYVVMVVGVFVLTAVSFWLISRLVVRPLAQLTEAAERIARGDYRVRVPSRGTNDEFDRTTAAFNRMAGEIEEYQSHLEDRVLGALHRMKKAEQHLAIAQRLAATGKLAAGVAHEINNPLGGMKNAVRALERGDMPPEKAGQYLELIADGLLRVEETVKKFLSFTPRRVEPRPSDLTDVARKAAALARHRLDRTDVRLEEVLPEEGRAVVFGDPHELQQVALNLLLNAADAVAGRDGARVALCVRERGDEVLLEVVDNGPGLTLEDQDRCFDMFFTTKGVGEGTGLGLAVAHTIVTNHGGRIEVESQPGKGATFRVVLPAEHGGSEGEEAASASGSGP